MESFYWIMGSVSYTLPLVFFTFVAGVVLERLASGGQPGRIRLVLCFALTFIAAGLTETFMAWQVGTLFLALAGSRLPAARRRWPWLSQLLFAAFAGAALGGLIVAAAPGNLVRTAVTPNPPLGLAEVMVRSFGDGLRFFVVRLASPMTLMVGGLAASMAVLLHAGPRPSWRALAVAAIVVAALAYVLIVATYLPPYQAIHRAPPARSLTTAVASLLIATVAWGWMGGVLLRSILEDRKVGYRRAFPVASMAIALGVSVLAATTLRAEIRRQPELARFTAAWEDRDQALRRAGDDGTRTATVQPIPTFTVALAEPTEDPNFWVNGCIARFYGVSQVVAG
jgi:hypothetical protein